MRIKFEAVCNIPNDIKDAKLYIQRELDIHEEIRGFIYNSIVLSVVEEKESEPRKDIIEGIPCPICGFNGEISKLEENEKEIKCYCPQCHNTFIMNNGKLNK